MTIMKVAAVQMRSGTSPERNAADMERMVREAVRQGAAYVQTPEVTGAMVRDEEARAAAFTSEDKDLVVATARRLARDPAPGRQARQSRAAFLAAGRTRRGL
jgi:predicted amidohydrolase